MMNRLVFAGLALLLACSAVAARADAFDYLMRVEGVEVAAPRAGYGDWFELQSFGFTVQVQVDRAGGRPDLVVNLSDVTFGKRVDAASPQLMEVMLDPRREGARIQVDVLRVGGGKVFSYRFDEAFLNSLTHSGTSGAESFENGTFEYGRIRMQAFTDRTDGGASEPGPSFDYKRDDPKGFSASAFSAVRAFDPMFGNVPPPIPMPVPEPATWVALAGGLFGLAATGRMKRRRETVRAA